MQLDYWLLSIHLDWKSIKTLRPCTLEDVLDGYKSVFSEELESSRLDKYPIPKIEDLSAKIAGGKRLDMSQAYKQLVLDKESYECGEIYSSRSLQI